MPRNHKTTAPTAHINKSNVLYYAHPAGEITEFEQMMLDAEANIEAFNARQPIYMPWEVFASAAMAVPNGDGVDRNAWRDMAFAIHHQSEGSEEGRTLFQAWSAKWTGVGRDGGSNSPDNNDKVWNSIRPNRKGKIVTGRSVTYLAKKAGWIDPREETVLDSFGDPIPEAAVVALAEWKAKRDAKEVKTVMPKGTLRFHYDDQLDALSDEIDFVQGLLLENSTSTIIGPTGSGKSFFALDIALHLALGIPWHGRKVEKSGVIIAALEGVGGIRKRYKALRQKYDITESLPIAFAEGSFDVRKGKTTRDALIAFAKEAAAKWGVPVRWIVIDTLNRGMAGGKESDSADMGAFREGMDYLRRATGANICTIHHTGKDESRGGRGSNVLVSDVDTEMTTTLHDDKTSVVRLTKQKDGAKALLGAFELAVVKLGYNDHWGDEVTSCVLKWVDMPVKGEELSASEQAAYAVLRELAGTPSKGVPEDAFRTACINGRKVSAAKTEKDRGRSFTRSYRSLISKGFVEARDGSVFIIEGSFDGPDEGDE